MTMMYSGEPGNRTTYTFCTWCNEMITRTYAQAYNKKYHACSPECQKKLSALYQSKEWKMMTDKQRNWVGRIGYKQYTEDWAKYRHGQAVEYLKAATPSQLAKVKRCVLKNPENMLLAHYEVFKEDPESLSSKFIDNIMGWNDEEVKT